MAKTLKSVQFFALFFLVILLAGSEMTAVEALCSKRSKTWSGPCFITSRCDRQCKRWENAKHGACHRSGWGFACFCYFNKC
uniref:Plant defensin 1.2-like protein PDF1.2-1 n=1 Tax=Dimocarpus longan TaxID=128017 RepID=A0A0F6TMY6_9ROSI|nr:plant defensin 1.2-like protein PDF1.2-1 [Dimocarpus longan]